LINQRESFGSWEETEINIAHTPMNNFKTELK